MAAGEEMFFDWAAFTPETAAAEMARCLDADEKAVAALEAANPTRYEDLIWALDDATISTYRCWGRISHELSVMNSEKWRKVEEDWQGRVVAFSLRVGQSAALYAAAKRILAENAALPPVRKRILEHLVRSAEHAGVGLEGETRARFNDLETLLSKTASDFMNAVIDATKTFSCEKDGKTYTIDDARYPETMKHCADAEIRKKLYRARATRAPENGKRVREILAMRREVAAILGYANYADLSFSTKSAPSVAAVNDMIDRLDRATAEPAAKEAAALGGDKVAPWDVAYLAERLRERAYAYSEEELKKHFEFETVLAGLFRLARTLFGVKVSEVKDDAKPSVWHPDVRFFEVREGGETIAHFYLDPYVRNGQKSGGAWMNEFRNRRVRGGKAETPLAVVVLNLPPPDGDGKTLLPMREVETLFHEFGHALQCMLTRVDEEDAAGINLVEWDAVEVASQFMENWCLDDRTGIPLPDDLKAKVRAARNFRAASACRRQLAFAKTDLDLHTAPCDDPDALTRERFVHFGLPFIEEGRFLNAFTHIFSGGYAAGYYGYKWAEVMSADCFGAFEEAGLDDEAKVRETGRRYRETILALGGSESAGDVFRRFRGRDPEIDALLRQQGILDSTSEEKKDKEK